jgi:glyoxalase family protein
VKKQISGIHHITAICGEPQRNVDFYAGVLGLRLVKRTVNFDDPKTYHLYYGDGTGSPGTILTFFPWVGVGRGRLGNGQVTATAFAVPQGSIPFWTERLKQFGVAFDGPSTRFGEDVLAFADPDGMQVELIASARIDPKKAYAGGAIPVEYAIHGFHSATLSEAALEDTASLLTDTMGFQPVQHDGNRFRFAVGTGEAGTTVDILVTPDAPFGRVAGGSVHHIAWRTADDVQQREWLSDLTKLGYSVSPVMDRKYFHSIYYREPGGILFEIATDSPGFAVDEPAEKLGSSLVLPAWLEPARQEIEAVLPQIELPVKAEEVVSR